MTLSNNYLPTKVSANGIIVDFGFTWNGLNTSYIKVYLEDKTTGDQTLVESTEYTFTAFNESGGNVRFNTAPADTNFVIIAREVDETQETPYKTSLGFNGEDVEASFDKLTGKVQELTEQVKRSPTMPIGTDIEANFPVPVPGNLIQGRADGQGWEDSGVSSQDLVDDAESARQSAIAAAASETAAANSAAEASGYADDAEESAQISRGQFKGDWDMDYVDPISGLDGYIIGDTVVFEANQWWSKTDENTSTPPLEYNTPSDDWEHFLRGAITNDEFVADVKEAQFLGDGLETSFDLTGYDATFRPTQKNQILAVFIDTEPLSEEDYIVTIDGVTGHSLLVFNTAPDAPVDPNATYNILVKGATPKVVTGVGEYTIVTEDVQTTPDYNKFTWSGKISSEGGAILESETDLVVQGSWSFGSPTIDKANKRIEQLSSSESLAVMLNGEIENPISFADMDDFDYWFDYEFTGDPATQDYLLGCLGKAPDTDAFGLLLRVYSGQLVFWASSDGATWDIANTLPGTKTDFTTGRYQFRIVKDSTAGTYEVFWSNDGKLKTDPTKTWTSDIVVNNSSNIVYVPSATAGMIGFGGDSFDYELLNRRPPEYTYYENCGFEDTTGGGNVDIATSAMAAGFIFVPNTEYHQFVGYSGTELVSELCYNADGSDLDVIDGDKALVFSGKTYDNALSYTFMKYYDEYNERFYLTHPSEVIHSSSSTVAATFLTSHLRPANSEKISMEYYIVGGYMNIFITDDHTPDISKVVQQYRNVADGNDDQIGNWWIPNIFKSDQCIVNRDSYDSNVSSLYSWGHSLKRGGRL